jgi:hypothetical protein
VSSPRAAWWAAQDWFHEKHPALSVASLPEVAIASVFFITMSVLLAARLPLQYTHDAQDLLEGEPRIAYVTSLVDARRLCITPGDPVASCSPAERKSISDSDVYLKMKLETERAGLIGCRASFARNRDAPPTDFRVCQSKDHPTASSWIVVGFLVVNVLTAAGFRLATRRPIWLRSTLPRSVRRMRVFLPTWCSVTLAAAPVLSFSVVLLRRFELDLRSDAHVFAIDFLVLMAVLANFLVLDVKTSSLRERGFQAGLLLGIGTLVSAALVILVLAHWLNANDIAWGTPIAVIGTSLVIVWTATWLMRTQPTLRGTFVVTRLFVMRGCVLNAPFLVFGTAQFLGVFHTRLHIWNLPGILGWLLLCALLLSWCMWIEIAMPWDRGPITTQVGPGRNHAD